jgi:NAD+ diphosphatase
MVDPGGGLLFLKRAKNPSKGLLGLPGGFIDAGETAEEGLVREIREEIGVEVAELRYLASFPNLYNYQGVAYSVLDFFFVAFLEDFAKATAEPGEVEEIVKISPGEVDYEKIAFPSMKKAVAFYLENKDKLPH